MSPVKPVPSPSQGVHLDWTQTQANGVPPASTSAPATTSPGREPAAAARVDISAATHAEAEQPQSRATRAAVHAAAAAFLREQPGSKASPAAAAAAAATTPVAARANAEWANNVKDRIASIIAQHPATFDGAAVDYGSVASAIVDAVHVAESPAISERVRYAAPRSSAVGPPPPPPAAYHAAVPRAPPPPPDHYHEALPSPRSHYSPSTAHHRSPERGGGGGGQRRSPGYYPPAQRSPSYGMPPPAAQRSPDYGMSRRSPHFMPEHDDDHGYGGGYGGGGREGEPGYHDAYAATTTTAAYAATTGSARFAYGDAMPGEGYSPGGYAAAEGGDAHQLVPAHGGGDGHDVVAPLRQLRERVALELYASAEQLYACVEGDFRELPSSIRRKPVAITETELREFHVALQRVTSGLLKWTLLIYLRAHATLERISDFTSADNLMGDVDDAPPARGRAADRGRRNGNGGGGGGAPGYLQARLQEVLKEANAAWGHRRREKPERKWVKLYGHPWRRLARAGSAQYSSARRNIGEVEKTLGVTRACTAGPREFWKCVAPKKPGLLLMHVHEDWPAEPRREVYEAQVWSLLLLVRCRERDNGLRLRRDEPQRKLLDLRLYELLLVMMRRQLLDDGSVREISPDVTTNFAIEFGCDEEMSSIVERGFGA